MSDEQLDELDDLAAEPDDTYVPDVSADDDDDDDVTYDGVCADGPYAGKRASSRFPRGFLLVDRPRRRVWVYAYAGGVFTSGPARVLDNDARWLAADGDEYDVVAYDDRTVR